MRFVPTGLPAFVLTAAPPAGEGGRVSQHRHQARHPAPLSTSYTVLFCISPYQVCPWTLFLTMSLTLLKGLMPHVPAMLPLLVSDPEMRSRAEETFMSPEFQENIEQYFVQNIKVSILSNAHYPVQEWGFDRYEYSKRS